MSGPSAACRRARSSAACWFRAWCAAARPGRAPKCVTCGTASAQAHRLSPLQNGPLERWLWGWDVSNSLAWQGLEMAMRMFSPAQLNPFGHNPLRPVLADLLQPACWPIRARRA